ncbi:hypothetical protein B0H14DRAFT_3642827 [Mycena olivaceomarginata]|nr:hypothetical protein B0H14DRAFT_3642827 [Mycena olivaceomarginata]
MAQSRCCRPYMQVKQNCIGSEEEQMQRINLCCSGPAPDYFSILSTLELSLHGPRAEHIAAHVINEHAVKWPGSGSWPLPRVGHGTPIDGGRRSAWAGNGSACGEDSDEVTEDGVLVSTVCSTSINSAPQLSQRSISLLAECNYVSPAPLPLAYELSTERRQSMLSLLLLPLPESVQIQLPGNQSQNQPQLVGRVGVDHAEGAHLAHFRHSIDIDAGAVVRDALRVGDAAEHEREMDLELESLHAAVDQGLGLIPGGLTWFDVGILPSSGRASPSVYSCDQHSTPRLSRPQSADPSEMTTDSTRFQMRERLKSRLWWQCFRDMLLRRKTEA